MASSSICSGCSHYQCEGCSLPKSQRLNAAAVIERGPNTVSKSIPVALGALPSKPSADRHYVPWFPGRKNGFAQMCACCKTEVAEGAGHLAKISSTDATWYVFCEECATTGAMITVPGSDEPEEATVRGKMKDGMVAFHDIEEAGRQHFARQQAAVVMGPVNVHPHTPQTVDFEIMENIAKGIERSLNAEFALILNAVPDPKASVSLGGSYSRVERDAILGLMYSIRNWQHQEAGIMGSPFPPKPNLYQEPERKGARPKMVHHDASYAGLRWADSVNHTSERDTMLGAGFGELPPSKMRKHRAKRPKRVGW